MAVVTGTTRVTSYDQQVPTGVPIPTGQPAANPLPYQLGINCSFANGTALDQVDLVYFTTLTFVASTPQVLDLTSLLDPLGGVVNFKRIKKIIIKPKGLVDNVILKLGYSGVTSNAWISLVTNPGQISLQAAPTANNDAGFVILAPNATGYVVGATNKLLNLDPGTAAYSVDIELQGASV